jgi:hypothetical protein
LPRYKLLLNIGAAGCGVEFLAEQKKPVQRRVTGSPDAGPWR